jgi:hypothetical protein
VATLVAAIIVTAATADASILVSVTVLSRATWYQQHELSGETNLQSCSQHYHWCVLRLWQWAWWIRYGDREAVDTDESPLVSLHDLHVGIYSSGGCMEIDASDGASGSGASGGAAGTRVPSLAPMASLPHLSIHANAGNHPGGTDLAVVLSSGAEIDGIIYMFSLPI